MSSHDNKEFWNRFARFYGFFMKKIDKTYAEMNGYIIPLLNDKMDVLELACGTGQLSFSLAKFVNSYKATDFSPEMVDKAKENNRKESVDNLLFEIQDATNLGYMDNVFDAVIISNAMHVVPDPVAVLNEIKRVLKPDGLLIAPTFVWGKNLGNRLNLFFLNKIGFKVFNYWSESEYMEFLTSNGFNIIDHRLIGNKLSLLCYVAAKEA